AADAPAPQQLDLHLFIGDRRLAWPELRDGRVAGVSQLGADAYAQALELRLLLGHALRQCARLFSALLDLGAQRLRFVAARNQASDGKARQIVLVSGQRQSDVLLEPAHLVFAPQQLFLEPFLLVAQRFETGALSVQL